MEQSGEESAVLSRRPRWRRLDNTAKIFPGITNEDLSNVFRVSATLKEPVDRELLEKALNRVLPRRWGFRVKLRRGFFWYYFEANRRRPRVERESTYPCRFIDPHSNQLYLFRVSFFECRINLEVFHALTDGLGGVNFLKALVCEYLDLARARSRVPESSGPLETAGKGKALRAGMPPGDLQDMEDSYKRFSRRMKKKKYATAEAVQLTGELFPLDECGVIHGRLPLEAVKAAAKEKGVSITKYLAAALIWSVFQEYDAGDGPVGINLPVNLRNIFGSETEANFFAVTLITHWRRDGEDFGEILADVSAQMDENLKRERLEQTISYNVASERSLLVRLVPLPLKGVGLRAVFARSSRAYTLTLSNLGDIRMDPAYSGDVRSFSSIIGVSARQPLKCVITSYEGEMVVSFTSVFQDIRLQSRFFSFLKEQGIPAVLEGNGMPAAEAADEGSMPVPPRVMYPEIRENVKKLKGAINVFYGALAVIALALMAVNWATYGSVGVKWSLIAAAGMAYAAMTLRYSILRSANLAFKLVIQSLGMQAMLWAVDWLTGNRGWAVNYAIPGVIMFDVAAVAGLMVFSRLNWQSYFMYQIAVTVFSFMPLILIWAGVVTRPWMTVAAAVMAVILLVCTALFGDRNVKDELIRRFHI